MSTTWNRVIVDPASYSADLRAAGLVAEHAGKLEHRGIWQFWSVLDNIHGGFQDCGVGCQWIEALL